MRYVYCCYIIRMRSPTDELLCHPYEIAWCRKKYGVALLRRRTKLRASSHNLEIERGRYTRPITNLEERLCPVCHVVDNEIHFVTRFRIDKNLRVPLWNKIKMIQPDFFKLDDKSKFCYLMSIVNSDPRTLSWFGKYVYQSFNVRNEKVYGNQWFIDFFSLLQMYL